MDETDTAAAAPARDDDHCRRIHRQRDVLLNELIRQEHDALRWESPHQPPEWTQRLRQAVGIDWVADCASCAGAPPRFYRDRRRWPDLHGWEPQACDVAEAACLSGDDPGHVATAPFLATPRRAALVAGDADPT